MYEPCNENDYTDQCNINNTVNNVGHEQMLILTFEHSLIFNFECLIPTHELISKYFSLRIFVK